MAAPNRKVISPDLIVDYDDEADVLYLSAGAPRAGEGDYVGGIIYRVSDDDGQPCGATVMNASLQYIEGHLADRLASHLEIDAHDVDDVIRPIFS